MIKWPPPQGHLFHPSTFSQAVAVSVGNIGKLIFVSPQITFSMIVQKGNRGSDLEIKMADDSSPPNPHRRPRSWGVVAVERVLPHVRPRLASEDAVVRLLSLRDAVQWRPAGDAHVQQHLLMSWRTWNRGLRYVGTLYLVWFCFVLGFFLAPIFQQCY